MKIRFFCLCMFVFLLPLCLFGCIKEEKMDYSELERRTVKSDSRFAFDYDSLFFTDSAYYITYSLLSPQDALLILQNDADDGITGIKLTVAREDFTETMLPLFRDFCRALTLSFAPDNTAEALLEVSGITQLNTDYPTDMIGGNVKRYHVTLFTDNTGVCFCLERI